MKPLNESAQAILDAFDQAPAGAWIDPLDLEKASGLSTGAYYANVGILRRRGLVIRDYAGYYRRVTGGTS